MIGLLHPGQMGAAIGRVLTSAGHQVAWCPAGRSAAPAGRAEEAGLGAVGSMAELASAASAVFDRWAGDKDASLDVAEVLRHLRRDGDD
jgi:3-hydroxyisobutyrate dehydrogenase-like beta-hydroxyacid dehydrogenase